VSGRGEKKDARHRERVKNNTITRRITVDSVNDYVLTAKSRLRWSGDSLRLLGYGELADSARRLASEVDRFERRVNEALEKEKA